MKQEVVRLIKEIQAGNQEAFQALYEITYDETYRMAMHICKNHQDALDVCQDTYEELFKSIYHLKEPESFYLWLSRIVTSKCTRLFRKNRYLSLEPSAIVSLPNMEERRKQYIPNKSLDDEIERTTMREFVDLLSPKLKEVVQLVYFEQMSIEECSVLLQIPVGTVKSRLHLARKQLKKDISEFEKQEQRKVHFHEGVSAWIIGHMALAKDCVKQAVQTHTTLVTTALNVAAVSSVTAMTVLTVQGANEVIHPTSPQQSIQQPSSNIQDPLPSQQNKPSSSFQVSYRNQMYESCKQAYYEILRWGQAPEIVKEEKQAQDILEIKPLYDEIKESQGPYWDLLLQDGWQSIFESV